MKKLIILFLITTILSFCNPVFAQSFYVKFKSEKPDSSHICSVYISGFLNKQVYTQSIQLPSDRYWKLRADSFKCLTLTLDCYNFFSFVLDEKKFSVGDSVIVDMDNKSAIILNKKKLISN